MVICKYYRQGNCRYGQYCQFEHINHFGNTKTEDDIVILVAKEVLFAERGGQWLLSCFAPLKERPCIPGMEDLSPEEVRWETYNAQKNGMGEQAKLHFQQLCQEMKAKREVLKNPTRETMTMLKKILGSGQKVSQLGLVNNTSANNVFGNTTYNVQNNNPFGGGGFTSSNNTSSIFGKSNNNTASVFNNTATFGNNLGGFGTTTSGASSLFGTTSTSTFSSVQNSAPTFGTPQTNSIFAPSQNLFDPNNVFGGTGQLGNAPTTSLFNNPMTSQANTSLFGGPTTTTSNLFGSSSTGLQTNPVFGVSTTSSGSFNSGMFTQPKTQMHAFGGAPVFAGVTNYANNSTGSSIFSSGQTFGAPTSSIFAGSTVTATPAFGAAVAMTTPAFGTPIVAATIPGFGASIATTAPAFDLSQQPSNNTFGTTVSAANVFGAQNTDTMSANNTPFGAPSATISGPFVTTSSQQFDSTNTSSAPFAGTGFGVAVASTNNTFGTTETSSNSIFANAGTTFATSNGTVPNPSPFSASTFGGINTSSPFGSPANTTVTTTTLANPFTPRPQQGVSPFGNMAQNQSNINASPFGKLPFNTTTTNIIDDTVYSADGALTDDEKNMFLAERFIIGKIPLKPPTKDIR
ncbi:PREDICTED: nuclear pore complex protein DDB_G0274915-like isoform X2 [Cyphomyrmex costatus]|uniref:nuclear pore complex protein DDB_G0274915-like isoform X2 n=1 Tax=Cyphomyrmex costatus TaxID=456900 RepID=UPI0008523592|nr:PREDICTED: nuclear pore complex protein DDB_G0274915-like isoform X2 [Cyphomyrmex costatus]